MRPDTEEAEFGEKAGTKQATGHLHCNAVLMFSVNTGSKESHTCEV